MFSEIYLNYLNICAAKANRSNVTEAVMDVEESGDPRIAWMTSTAALFPQPKLFIAVVMTPTPVLKESARGTWLVYSHDWNWNGKKSFRDWALYWFYKKILKCYYLGFACSLAYVTTWPMCDVGFHQSRGYHGFFQDKK